MYMGDKYYKQWKSRKKIKRSPVYRFGMIVLGVLILAVSFYLRSQDDDITYSSSQNNQGFYFYSEVPENTYYTSLNGLEGETLKQAMHVLLNTDFTPTSYGDARVHLENADRSLTDPTKVWNIYDGLLVPSTWDSDNNYWHREHVWPNSRLGVERVDNSDKSIASDLHNLRAVTPSVNSSRGDRFYSEGSGEAKITDDGGFYPGDEHKGDVARIIFYMYIMYEELELRDDNLDGLDTYTVEGAVMGILTTLLKWHKEDPVSDFERARNQIIYEVQHNRNPFIDKPEYAHLIFEDKTINELLPEPTLTAWIDERRSWIYG